MLSPFKIAKLSKYLIYFTLFAPLMIIPFTMWEFVFVRSLIFYCLVAILLFLGLLYLYKDRHNINFKVNVLFWLIFSFVVVRIISGIFGADSHNSFFGSQIRMDGNLGYVMLFGWLIMLLLFLTSHEDWKKLFKVSAIAALIVSVFAVIQAFFSYDFGALSGKAEGVKFLAHRLTGSLGNPIFLAGYILPHIFLALYLAVKETKSRKRYFWIALSVIFLIIVLLTRTRGAAISLITTFVLLGGALLFYLVSNKKKISFKKIAIFGAPLLVLVGFVVVNTDLISRLTNFSLTSGTIATRLLLWKIGIQAFFDKWLFGWGPENFTYAFSKFYNPRLLKFSFYETWADKPHNQLIEIATTSGIFGLIAFLGIILFSLYALWRLFIKDRTQLFPYLLIGGAIISYFIHIFFAFDTLELRMILFMVLGYIIFLTSRAFNVKGLSFSLIRGFILIVLITAVVSLNIIGIKTIYASYCADEARNSIIDNKYMDIKASFNKLKDIETPYKNGNWEVLADRLLESNAVGRMPKSVMVEILPTIITGLEEAAKEQEENFSYHYRLGQMYHLAGDYIDKKYFDKSVEALEQAKKISPKRQVSDLLLAQIYYSKRDTEKGIKLLEDLIKETPNVAEPYWYLGILYDAGGEYDKSYAYMTTAAEKGYSPKSINEEFLYVTVLGRFNDYYKMAPVYESIIEKDKTNPRWWANIAVVYLELEKYEKARDATRQAMFLDPKFGDEGEGFLRKIDEKEKGEK